MPVILSYANPSAPKPTSNDLFDLKVIAISHDLLGILCFFPAMVGLIVSDDPSINLPLILMLIGGLALVASGLCIHRRRLRVFSLIVAALLCLMFPMGTIPGVATLRVLSRSTVIAHYRQSQVSPMTTCL